MDENQEEQISTKPNKWRKVRLSVGYILIAISGISFFSIFSLGYWPISRNEKLIAAGVLYGISSISWWTSVLLVGKSFLNWLKGLALPIWLFLKSIFKRN